MDFDKRPHGIDFGRYTVWARPDTSPKPIDFVVAGITSGNYALPTFDANEIHLREEERLMTYHFYETYKWNGRTPQVQADVYSKYADMVEPKALAVDWEDTSYFTLERTDVKQLVAMFEILEKRYPRVFLYSNIDDFELIVQYAPDFAKNVELWIAYPPKNEYSEWVDWPYADEGRLGRPWSSVRFLQYSWWGDAQLYGAVNEKKQMDLDYYQGTMEELDAWLGITTPEPPGNGDDMSEQLNRIEGKLDLFWEHFQQHEKNLADAYLDIMAKLDGTTPTEPPVEPPVEPPTDEYIHLRFLQKAKDFIPMYRLVLNVENGKYKADKIDGDNISQGEVVKLITTGGNKFLADGNEIKEDMIMAANMEYSELNEAKVDGRLMYIEATINGQLRKGVTYFDSARNIWRDVATQEDWTP